MNIWIFIYTCEKNALFCASLREKYLISLPSTGLLAGIPWYCGLSCCDFSKPICISSC
jgi:hypothetical protein